MKIILSGITTLGIELCARLQDEGRVVGQGTHEQLLATCPQYRDIAYSQLSPEELGESAIGGERR